LVVETHVEWESVDVRLDHSDEVALVVSQGWHYIGVQLFGVELDALLVSSLDVLEQSEGLSSWSTAHNLLDLEFELSDLGVLVVESLGLLVSSETLPNLERGEHLSNEFLALSFVVLLVDIDVEVVLLGLGVLLDLDFDDLALLVLQDELGDHVSSLGVSLVPLVLGLQVG